jgi:hypothetical protein
MTLTDATIILLLAERIHGSDAGVRNAAKNVVKKLPRGQRDILFNVINSKRPQELVRQIALNLDS